MRNYCLVGTELIFGMIKHSGSGGGERTYATELCTVKSY